MKAYFQQEGKGDVDRHRLKNLTRQGVSTEAQFLRTIGGTPSEEIFLAGCQKSRKELKEARFFDTSY